MPWQKPQILPWQNLLTESLKMIMWLIVRCFYVHFTYKNTLYKNNEAHITQKLRTI